MPDNTATLGGANIPPGVAQGVIMWRRAAVVVSVVVSIVFTLMVMPAQVVAQSIAASPGILTAVNVPLGQKIFIHEVEIINGSDTSHAYSIYTKKPGLLKEGYEEIPDPSWIEVNKSEIEIEAQSRKAVEVWVRIPNNEANANRDYEGWVVAHEKAGGMVAVEVAVRVLLSTSEYNPSLPEEAPPEEAPPEEAPTPPLVTPPEPSEPSGTTEFPILPLAGIAAGAAIAITLIITLVRRRRY